MTQTAAKSAQHLAAINPHHQMGLAIALPFIMIGLALGIRALVMRWKKKRSAGPATPRGNSNPATSTPPPE